MRSSKRNPLRGETSNALLRLLRRLAYALRFRSHQAELREELALHRQLVIDDLERRGHAPESARAAAHRAMGNETYMREESRGVWLAPRLESVLHDWRYAWRGLRRSPVFALVAILSLGVGIGANTAIFGVIHAVLLARLPVPAPEELVQASRVLGAKGEDFRFSRDEVDALSTGSLPMTMFTSASALVAFDGVDDEASLDAVDGRFFQLLRLDANLGRLLMPGDVVAATPVAVVSDRYWRTRMLADSHAVGRIISVNRQAFTVVGVAPAGFTGVRFPIKTDVFVPYPAAIAAGVLREDNGRRQFATLIGRRTSGETIEQAERAVSARWQQCCGSGQLVELTRARTPLVSRLRLVDVSRGVPFAKVDLRGQYRRTLLALMAGVAILLLTACANVANLLLARSTARARELALRLALGASRGRLVAQLVVESVQLSLIGALVGLLLARWGTTLLVHAELGALSDVVAPSPNGTVLAFTAIVSVVAGIAFGVVPSLRVMRTDLVATIKQGGRGSRGARRHWLDRGLVALQMSLALLLVSAAMLLVQTLRNLEHVDLGFVPSHLLAVTVETRHTALERQGTTVAMADDILRAVRALPGVAHAGMASLVPVYGGRGVSDDVSIRGAAPRNDDDRQTAFVGVSPDYFSSVGMTLQRGHDIGRAPSSASGAPQREVVVNEVFARKFFGNLDPIGRTFDDGDGGTQHTENRVVGVVANAKFTDPRAAAEPMYFVPLTDGEWRYLIVTVRTSLDASAASKSIAKAVASAAPGVAIGSTIQLSASVEEALTRERVSASLAGFFGVVALALAAIGLYGVMLYQVTERTGEIGIRMALGARAASVVWLVLRQSLVVVGVGMAVGIPLSLMAGRAVASQLYGIAPSSAVAFALAAAVLLFAAVVATLVPARRAITVSPLTALREQ